MATLHRILSSCTTSVPRSDFPPTTFPGAAPRSSLDIEDDDAVQFFSCTRLWPNSIEHVSNCSSFYIYSRYVYIIYVRFLLPSYFLRSNPIQLLLWSCPQTKSPLMLMSKGICFLPVFTYLYSLYILLYISFLFNC
jgi:hypothetical protein